MMVRVMIVDSGVLSVAWISMVLLPTWRTRLDTSQSTLFVPRLGAFTCSGGGFAVVKAGAPVVTFLTLMKSTLPPRLLSVALPTMLIVLLLVTFGLVVGLETVI